MIITRIDTSDFTGDFVQARLASGILRVFLTRNVFDAAAIESLIEELRNIRRSAFPNYVDAASSISNIDLKEKP